MTRGLVLTCVVCCFACATPLPHKSSNYAVASPTTQTFVLRGNIDMPWGDEPMRLQAFGLSDTATLVALPGHSSSVADGQFTVHVALLAQAPGEVLLRADSPRGYGLLLVDGLALRAGRDDWRLTPETTLAAQLYLAARAQGFWPADIPAHAMLPLLDASLTRAFDQDAVGRSAQIDALARAVVADLEAARALPARGALARDAGSDAFEVYGRLLGDKSLAASLAEIDMTRARGIAAQLEQTLRLCGEPAATGQALNRSLLLRLTQLQKTQAPLSIERRHLQRIWSDYARAATRALARDCGVPAAAVARIEAQSDAHARHLAEHWRALDPADAPQAVGDSLAADARESDRLGDVMATSLRQRGVAATIAQALCASEITLARLNHRFALP